MTRNEVLKVKNYLRQLFDNDNLDVKLPAREGATVEVYMGDEFIGTMHRDDEEGEVSYDLNITILEEDLAEEVDFD